LARLLPHRYVSLAKRKALKVELTRLELVITTIALYRDWRLGAFAFESVEMTLLDLRLDYPKREVLTEMPLKKAGQLVSTPP
jgi:hypothetical protein